MLVGERTRLGLGALRPRRLIQDRRLILRERRDECAVPDDDAERDGRGHDAAVSVRTSPRRNHEPFAARAGIYLRSTPAVYSEK
jgi:hypothetical protein